MIRHSTWRIIFWVQKGHEGEWRILLNLTGLLFGFAILAKYFEDSKIPAMQITPKVIP